MNQRDQYIFGDEEETEYVQLQIIYIRENIEKFFVKENAHLIFIF